MSSPILATIAATFPATTFPTTSFPASTFPATTFPATTFPATTLPATTLPAATRVRIAPGFTDRTARLFALNMPQHRRCSAERFLHPDCHVTKNRIVEAQTVFEFGDGLWIGFDVEQNIVRLAHLANWISELPAAPVLETMDSTFLGLDHGFVPLNHGGHLFALIRMND